MGGLGRKERRRIGRRKEERDAKGDTSVLFLLLLGTFYVNVHLDSTYFVLSLSVCVSSHVFLFLRLLICGCAVIPLLTLYAPYPDNTQSASLSSSPLLGHLTQTNVIGISTRHASLHPYTKDQSPHGTKVEFFVVLSFLLCLAK